MKKFGLLVGFVLLLGICGMAAELYIENEARTGYTARLASLAMGAQAPNLVVVATVEVTNTTRADATFDGLTGTVTVGGTAQDWKLLEPQPGVTFEAGGTVPLQIEVSISAGNAVAIALSALAGGGLEMRFDGNLRAKAFGFWPINVELHDQQRLRPSL